MGRGKKKRWLRQLLKSQGLVENGGLDVTDTLVCTYHQEGRKHQLYERTNGTRYTIETGSGNVEERAKKKDSKKTRDVGWQGTGFGLSTCKHKPDKAIAVGTLKFYPFSYADTIEKELVKSEVNPIYALTNCLFTKLYGEGFKGTVYGIAFPDRGTLPKDVHMSIIKDMAVRAKKGEKVGFYCTGGHGRTGTILASLIALLERPEDPIKIARKRYCTHCVESNAQAELIFSVMGKDLPPAYKTEFKPPAISQGTYVDTVLKNFGFTWMGKANIVDLPSWMSEISYLEFPLLRELDQVVRSKYGQGLETIKNVWRRPLTCLSPGLAPATEKCTWWMIDKLTGEACRIAFKNDEKMEDGTEVDRDGEVLEYAMKLPRSQWPHVPLEEVEVSGD